MPLAESPRSSPALVVSLDFELRWGLLGAVGDDMNEYRESLEGVEEVVPRLLDAFTRDGVRATWATVGAVACGDWDEWRARAPAYPRYRNAAFSWRESFRLGDRAGRLHFAPHLVDAITRAEGQELASHTFGHVYFCEPGFTRDDAAADTDAAIRVFQEKWGLRVRSFVFPRNQVAHTDVLRDRGIVSWRNNPEVSYWNAGTEADETRAVRALRFADSIVPFGQRIAPIHANRASYFVRLTLPPGLWRLHRRRIAAEARHLGDGQALHLWFHPENIGRHAAQGVARFSELVAAVREAAPPSTRFTTLGEVTPAMAGA